MTDPATLEIVWRIAVAVFVMIMPSVLFLGLVRGLERLRDDAFIERWLHEQGHEIEDDVLTVVGTGIGLETDTSSTVQCAACGAANGGSATYCRNCLGRLPS